MFHELLMLAILSPPPPDFLLYQAVVVDEHCSSLGVRRPPQADQSPVPGLSRDLQRPPSGPDDGVAVAQV